MQLILPVKRQGMKSSFNVQVEQGTVGQVQRLGEIGNRQYTNDVSGIVHEFLRNGKGKGQHEKALVKMGFFILPGIVKEKESQQQPLENTQKDHRIKYTDMYICFHVLNVINFLCFSVCCHTYQVMCPAYRMVGCFEIASILIILENHKVLPVTPGILINLRAPEHIFNPGAM